MHRPDLREGVRWLVAIRTHWFPTTERRWSAITSRGETPTFRKRHCPLCEALVDPGWEWAHLLVSCRADTVRPMRRRHLVRSIERVKAEIEDVAGIGDAFVGINGVSDRTSVDGAVAIILVGGTVMRQHGCSQTYGFGQCELAPYGAVTHGFVNTALFLTEVAGQYAVKVGLHPYMGLEDNLRLREQDIRESSTQ